MASEEETILVVRTVTGGRPKTSTQSRLRIPISQYNQEIEMAENQERVPRYRLDDENVEGGKSRDQLTLEEIKVADQEKADRRAMRPTEETTE